jgi:hypothetical protein
MNKFFNLKNAFAGALTGGVILFSGCTKEKVETTAGPQVNYVVQKVSMDEQQQRVASEMYSRMPKLRYWDEHNNRFISMNPGSRDLVFSDPDEGFSFDDPDGNNAMVFSDNDGDYLVISSGFGVAGQGGGGSVVAGSTSLDIDVTICLSAQAVADGDGFGDLFGGDTGWTDFAAVFGISGDFEGLAENSDSDDFNPFEYLHGFAEYFVFTDDLNGSHEVFDWMGEDANSNLDDLASSFVMDFTNFNLYFASSGTISISGGQMYFNGTYLSIEDLFDSFLDEGLGDDEVTVNEVTGFGVMGCN